MNMTQENNLRHIIDRLRDKARRKVPTTDVEDLVQEVLVVLVERMQRPQPIDSLQAYADGVLRHVIYDYYQCKREQLSPQHDLGWDQVSPAPTPEQRIVWMRHLRVIENLAEENTIDASLMEDHFKNDVPLHEVASRLDVSAGAVNGRLFRFRQKVLKFAGSCFAWFIALCSGLWHRAAHATPWLRPSASTLTSMAVLTTGAFSFWLLAPLSSRKLIHHPSISHLAVSSPTASSFSTNTAWSLAFQTKHTLPAPHHATDHRNPSGQYHRMITHLHPQHDVAVVSSQLQQQPHVSVLAQSAQHALSAALVEGLRPPAPNRIESSITRSAQDFPGQNQLALAVQKTPQNTIGNRLDPSSGMLPLATGVEGWKTGGTITAHNNTAIAGVNPAPMMPMAAANHLTGSMANSAPALPSWATSPKTAPSSAADSTALQPSSVAAHHPTSTTPSTSTNVPNHQPKTSPTGIPGASLPKTSPTHVHKTIPETLSQTLSRQNPDLIVVRTDTIEAKLNTLKPEASRLAQPERHSFCMVQDSRIYRCDSGKMEDISGEFNATFSCQDTECQTLIGLGPSLVITTSQTLYVIGRYHFRKSLDQGVTWFTPTTVPASRELLAASSLILNQKGELWHRSSNQWNKKREYQPSVHEVRLHLDNKQCQAEDDTGFRLQHEWQPNTTTSQTLSSPSLEQVQTATSPLTQSKAHTLQQTPKQTPMPPKDEGSPIRMNP